ncbi:Transposon Ty3-I Gag-Pol polyprotein [Thelohanellus kitauei]|uniref:Transposon Ty3-I Gag-Pol polyprotein n=1 Tax=Thelohanellus kitauei TaxID=669202 RepID=A0A0C2J8R9_THEKT|nr:Transposon Ty3-I Gag-Pol polyprotein [Thelohanellus kitauei]
MPFGLVNAPATFQRLMDSIFGRLSGNGILSYLDDIVVFSDTLDGHMTSLETAFNALKNAGLKIKPKKCKFFCSEIKYLGFIVNQHGIKTDPEKTATITNWPQPKSKNDVLSFLGFCSYYRSFIKNLANVEYPLRQLTRKDTVFHWDNDLQNCFETLKRSLCSTPMLLYPDLKKSFILDIDASGYAIGAVLSQHEKYGDKEYVIQYASRILNPAEVRYSVTKRELLAIVWSLKKFRPYLLGTEFTIRTDHQPLLYIKNEKDIGGQLCRWMDLLAEYNFKIVHRKGQNHVNADFLSRTHVTCALHNAFNPNPFPSSQKELAEEQKNDPVISFFKENVKSGFCLPHLKGNDKYDILNRIRRSLIIKNDVLYRTYDSSSGRRLRYVVPESLVNSILKTFHNDMGHFAADKTKSKIVSRFYWPSMSSDIKNWCHSCIDCGQRNNPSRYTKEKMVENLSSFTWERVGVDITGPLPVSSKGFKYILVIQDYFSKFAVTIPLKRISAEYITDKFIDKFMMKYGIPLSVHSDMGTQFQSSLFQNMLSRFGIHKTNTTPYHPQSDGLVERLNRTLINSLSKIVPDDHEWDKHLSAVTFSYNVSKHSSTNEIPFEVMFKRPSYLPIDYNLRSDSENFRQYTDEEIGNIMSKILFSSSRAQRYQSSQYDKGRFSLNPEIGDFVYLFVPVDSQYTTNKLSKLWRGPYEVSEVKMPLIKIRTETGQKWIHANRCKKAQTQRCDNETAICEKKPEPPATNVTTPTYSPSHHPWESEDEEEQEENEETEDIEEEENVQDARTPYNLRPRENIRKPDKYCQEGETVFPWRGRTVTDVNEAE